MIVTILGCGTSTGVPRIGCKCSVCRSKNKKNNRTRASIWVQTKGKSLLVDTSIDLRQQALRERLNQIDAVLYTHPHADHIFGIDELRNYTFERKTPLPVYGNPWTIGELTRMLPYLFSGEKPEGGSIANLTTRLINDKVKEFQIDNVKIQAITVDHGSQKVLGYRFNHVAYITDCHYIPEDSLAQLKNLKVLILDCLRVGPPHRTHLTLEESLKVIEKTGARRTYLTHLSHQFDYSKWKKKLPKGVELAYDGLRIRTED